MVAEWGSFYILTRDGKMFVLQEKDTQTKLEVGTAQSVTMLSDEDAGEGTMLSPPVCGCCFFFKMLFKKNLFVMAINLAKSQHLDSDGLSEIFRQYGDHLYLKGDHDGAIQQYIR